MKLSVDLRKQLDEEIKEKNRVVKDLSSKISKHQESIDRTREELNTTKKKLVSISLPLVSLTGEYIFRVIFVRVRNYKSSSAVEAQIPFNTEGIMYLQIHIEEGYGGNMREVELLIETYSSIRKSVNKQGKLG